MFSFFHYEQTILNNGKATEMEENGCPIKTKVVATMGVSPNKANTTPTECDEVRSKTASNLSFG